MNVDGKSDGAVVPSTRANNAEADCAAVRERFAKFGLKLHDQKTRLIEFGRFALGNRKERGEGRPETFDFLGFTHRCDVTRSKGWFTIRRETIAKRMRATLAAIKEHLRQRRHWPLGVVGKWLGRVMRGWLNYHAIPGNGGRMGQFRDEIAKLWLRQLRSRSQRHRWPWTRMRRLARKHLPAREIRHESPNQRFRA